MTDSAGLERELGEFFGGLSAAVEAGEERRLGREVGIQQELAEFFGKLTAVRGNRGRTPPRARRRTPARTRRVLRQVTPVVRAEGTDAEQRGGLEAGPHGDVRLLEPTIAAATVAIKVMENARGRSRTAVPVAGSPRSTWSGRRNWTFPVFSAGFSTPGRHSQGDLFLSLLLEELKCGVGQCRRVLRDFQPNLPGAPGVPD